MNHLFCFIIPNYHGEKHLKDCLESLFKNPSKDFQVIVVDNDHQPESIKAIRKQFPQVKWLKNSKNLGFAKAINQGLKCSQKNQFKYSVLLNNDVVFPQNFVKNLKTTTQKYPKKLLFSPKIYFAPGYEYHYNQYTKSERGRVIWYAGGQIDWKNWLFSHFGVDQVDKGQFDQVRQTDFCTGCCLVVKNQILNKLKLMDERFFAYFEDTDYCLKAQKLGIKTWYLPGFYLWHKNAGSSGSGSSLHDYLLTRNRLLLAQKWAPLKTKLAVYRQALGQLITGRKWQKTGIRDFVLRRFKKGSLK